MYAVFPAKKIVYFFSKALIILCLRLLLGEPAAGLVTVHLIASLAPGDLLLNDQSFFQPATGISPFQGVDSGARSHCAATGGS